MAYIGVSPSNGLRRVHTYTATASQTTFSGAGAEGTSLSYKDSNFVDVYQNGIKLGDADYTSTSGTSIVLAQGASVDDLVVVVVFDVFSVADTVSKADGGTFDGNVTMAGTLAVTGNQTNSGSVTITGDLASSTSGTSNFRAGVNAGNSIASGGNYNTVVGDEAGTAITTGDQNTFVGYASGDAVTTSSDNTAVGKSSMSAMIDGASNTAVGLSALSDDTKGSKSTAVGYQALSSQNFTSATDSHNTAVGYNAGSLVSTGVQGVYIGSLAGDADTTGGKNTYVGYNSGTANAGDQNVFIGHSAGSAITDGDKNTIIGKYDGNSDGLDIRTGDNNIILSDGDGKPRFRINSSGRQSFQGGTVYGHINAIGEVGTSFVAIAFEHTTGGGVIGSISTSSSSTSFNTSSDYRMKENVQDMTGAIDRVKQLLPKRFNFIGDETENLVDGFLAHEAQTVVAESVHGTHNQVDENGNAIMQGIDQSKLVPLLTGALKEAIERIETLETKVKALEGNK